MRTTAKQRHGVPRSIPLRTMSQGPHPPPTPGMAPELVQKVGDLVEQGLQSIRIAEECGVTICYGSDLLGSLHCHQLKVFPPTQPVRRTSPRISCILQAIVGILTWRPCHRSGAPAQERSAAQLADSQVGNY